MFDPDGVRHDMRRLFSDGGVGERKPRSGTAIPAVTAGAMGGARTVSGRKGVLLTIGFLVITILIPLLVVVASFAIPAWRSHRIAVVAKGPPSAARPAPKPAAEPPSRSASAYAVIANDAAAVASGSQASRAWSRRWGVRRHRRARSTTHSPQPAAAALADAYVEDALVTRRLNESALDRLHPTLGYSPAVVDQAVRK